MSEHKLNQIAARGYSLLSTNWPASLPAKVAELAFLPFLARLTFAAAVVFLPFRYRFELMERPIPPIYTDYTNFQIYPSDIFVSLTLVLWLLSLLSAPRRINRGPLFVTLPLLAFPAIAALGSWASVDPPLSLYHATRLGLLFGLYLYVLNEIKTFSFLFIPVAVQLLVQSIVAIVQVLKGRSIGLQALGELELDPAWSGVSIVWAEGARSLRAYGLSDHPNILGGCLALALIFIAIWYLQTTHLWRGVLLSLFALGSLALLATYSRAAWLAFCLGILFVFASLIRTRKRSDLLALAGLSIAAILFLFPFVWANLPHLGTRLNAGGSFASVGPEIQSLGERKILNAATNRIFAEHALTGVGLGALPVAMRDAYPDLPVHYQPAHLVLFTVAAEIGILGALFYLVLSLAPWLALWLNRDRLHYSPALIGASALLLVLTVISLFDYYPWLLASGRLWQWLALGLWAGVYQSGRQADKS